MSGPAASADAWSLVVALLRYAPRLWLLDALLWIGIEGLFPAIPGLLIRAYFDSLADPALPGPAVWVLALLAVAAAHVLVIVLGRFTKTQHRFLISALLRHNLLAGMLARPGADALRVDGRPVAAGDALSTFRDDVEHVEDFVVGVSELAASGLFAVVSLAILLWINPALTLLVFLPLVAIVSVVRGLAARIRGYRAAGRAATAAVTGLLGETFGAIQAVKVAGAEAALVQQLERAGERRARAMVRDQLLEGTMRFVFDNTLSIGTGLILLVVALLRWRGELSLSVGDAALFISYLGFIGGFFGFFGGMSAAYRQIEVSLARMGGLVAAPTPAPLASAHQLYLKPLLAPQPPLPPPAPVPGPEPLHSLEVRGLTYRYPETGGGVSAIDLEVGAGELVVVTGQVGSGKTTLLRALQGLLPAQAGAIRWNGALVAAPAALFVPPRSAYTPQAPRLFSASLADNLRLGLTCDDAALEHSLEAAQFAQDYAALPDGLATQLGTRGVRLSGGQLQRVATARMLLRRPALLIVDDLSSALDVETEALLWRRLRAADALYRPAILAVSHRRDVLRRADRIVVLAAGRVVASGPPAELIERSDELRRIWFGQAAAT